MPQPIREEREGRTYRAPSKVIFSERPEHARRIGLVITEWAALEEELIHLFAFGVFTYSESEQGADNVARTALESIESLSGKLDIIQALLETRVSKEMFDYFVCTIKPEIRQRSRERNIAAHTRWFVCDDFPDDIIEFTPEGRVKHSQKDFENIADRIIKTSRQISGFMMEISKEMAEARYGKPILDIGPKCFGN